MKLVEDVKSELGKLTAAAWLRIAIYAVLLVGLYYSSYSVMLKWWQRDDYTYCYLVPAIVVYLIWDRRKQLQAAPLQPAGAGIPIVLLGVGLFWLGELGGEYYSLYISSWVILVGIVVGHLGWARFRRIGFPIFFMLTMFPPPNFIYRKLSVSLKLISSQLGVAVMQMAGMTAYREGNVIDLGFTRLQVVDACSGLRYLIPLTVLGLLMAYFYKARLWKKVLIVLSTTPISVTVNGLRIASVGFLYQFWGQAVAEGFFHDFSGWFIFMASLALLVAEMKLLNLVFKDNLTGQVAALSGTGRLPAGAAGDGGNVTGDSGAPRPAGREPWRKGFLYPPVFAVAVVAIGLTALLSYGVEFREKIPVARPLDRFPLSVGRWTGAREPMDQQFVDELNFDDYVIVNYRDPDGRTINFYVAYYGTQRKGEAIHSPETCLPGGGWLFKHSGSMDLPSTDGRKPVSVNRALTVKDDQRQMMAYWFPMRGRVLTSAYQMKLYNFWDALTQQRTDGALVRIITPVYGDESPETAERRLKTFSTEIFPILNDFLPGPTTRRQPAE